MPLELTFPASQTVDATIPLGGVNSSVIDIRSAPYISFVIDEAFTGADLQLLVSVSASGPFYDPVVNGVAFQPTAAGVLSPSSSQLHWLRPFRFFQLRSTAPLPLSDLTLTVKPNGQAVTAGVEQLIFTGLMTGALFDDDTFTLDGDATVYTVINGPAVADGTDITVEFSPPLAFNTAEDTVVTFVLASGDPGGEASERTIHVVTKSVPAGISATAVD